MGKLTIASIKMLYRDKQALFWAIMFPILFTVIFGLFDFGKGPKVRIEVAASSPSPASEALVAQLRRIESFDVSTGTDEASARAKLARGDLDVVAAVPAGAGIGSGPAASPVTAYYDEGNFDRNQVALSAMRQIVDGMNLVLAGVRTPPVTFEATPMSSRQIKYYDFLLPGLVAMGVMNFSIIGMAVAISRFREQRILRRILATPLRPAKFLAAQVIARLVLSTAQTGLILVVGVTFFHAHIYGNVLWLFVLATIANLIFLNLGFAVAGRASSPDAAQGVGNVVALPMMFLSGVFFPTDTLPKVMQVVVKFLPLTPLIKAMRSVALDGKSITATGSELAQLAAWMVAAFGVAAATFRFSER